MSRIGRDQVVGVGLQSTRGTGVSADYWLQKINFEFNREVTHVADVSALGVSAMSAGVAVANKKSAPTISAYVDINAFGLLSYLDFETYADSANADGSGNVYDHTYKVGVATTNERLATINVEDGNLEGDQDVVDAMLNKSTLSFDMDNYVTTDLEFVGKYPVGGTNTSSFSTPTNFLGRHVTIKYATSVSGLSGGTTLTSKSGSVVINGNINNDSKAFNLGNIDIADHHKQGRNIEISISRYLEDQAFIDLMESGATRALQITIVDTGTTIGTAANPTLVYTFPKVSFKSTPAGGNDELRTEDLVLMPHYGLDNAESASYMAKLVVTNLVTDYEA